MGGSKKKKTKVKNLFALVVLLVALDHVRILHTALRQIDVSWPPHNHKHDKSS